MNRQLRKATAHSVRSDIARLYRATSNAPTEYAIVSATYTVAHQGTTVATGTATVLQSTYTPTSVTARTEVAMTAGDGAETLAPGYVIVFVFADGRHDYRTITDVGSVTEEGVTTVTVWLDRGLDELPTGAATSSATWALTATQSATARRDVTVDLVVTDEADAVYYLRDIVDIVATPLANPCTVDEFVSRWPGYSDRSRLPSPEYTAALLEGVWDEVCARVVASGLRPDAIISLEQLARPTYTALAYRLCQSGYYPGSHDDRTSLREEIGQQADAALDSCLSYVSALDTDDDGAADEAPARRGVIRMGR